MSLKREKVLKGPQLKSNRKTSLYIAYRKIELKLKLYHGGQSVHRKVPFNFRFKIGMENDIFVYLNFDSKLKKDNFILFQNTKLPLIKLTII